mmetsp:Transcript_6593/g.9793  ORF Transcript_6593/g.9793 Transcript_6593/m.9793 type:complete len:253 (+) Transcript_6593:224-982(+)
MRRNMMKLVKVTSCLLLVSVTVNAATDEQCLGFDPQPNLVNYLGASLNYETADSICCHNHRYAEYRGYLAAPEVDLFGRLNPDEETIFYDSVCGIPLFIAPRGRTFEEFKKESLKHGWPSFRPEELVSENVIIHNDGRMESKCLTHLGHNLPEGGIDRYCIDLVCIAGAPLSFDDEIVKVMMDDVIITADELNATNYTSSAEKFSGKTSNERPLVITIFVIASFIIASMTFCFVKNNCDKSKNTHTDLPTIA